MGVVRCVGAAEGTALGTAVGRVVGAGVGALEGAVVGTAVGLKVGATVRATSITATLIPFWLMNSTVVVVSSALQVALADGGE